MEKKNTRNFFYRMLCGAFLGISIIAPGVSGSIMAVMMGIYDELIGIISNPFKNFKKNFFYALPMVIGAGISMLLLVEGLDWLFDNHTVPAYLLFMSLIAGSIPTVWGEIDKKSIKKHYFVFAFLALAFAFTIGYLAKHGFTVSSDNGLIYLCISGAVAGMMSMVPGMSVSMILMMFGVYQTLLDGAAKLDVLLIAPVALCFVAGMILFSNITKKVFEKFRSLGFLLVLGFMTGSLISIFPGLPSGMIEWILSFVAIALGISVSFVFKILGKKTEKNIENNTKI